MKEADQCQDGLHNKGKNNRYKETIQLNVDNWKKQIILKYVHFCLRDLVIVPPPYHLHAFIG